MGSGVYSQNGILTFIAMNFYIVSDAWSRVAAIVATSFSIYLLSVMLPSSNNTKMNESDESFYVRTKIM